MFQKSATKNKNSKRPSQPSFSDRRPKGGRDYFKRRNTVSATGPKPHQLTQTKEAKDPVRTLLPGQVKAAAPVLESSLTFADFDLPEELEKALGESGYERPTPIQEQSLPHTLGGFDLIGCAQTGTGKTAAFVLPMLTRLLEDEDAQALVLAPTRELAAQILDTFKKLANHARHLRPQLIIGGASFHEQNRMLRQGPRILVATPGRLVDHLQQKTIQLSRVKFLVLDEADRMFDMGFAPQIDKILRQIPKERQTLLFSATFSPEIRKLALRSLREPKEVFIGAPSRAAEGVEQEILEISTQQKFPMLLDELNKREGTVLLFTGMKHRADKLARSLQDYGHSVARIHGGRTMGQRNSAIKDFRSQKVRILVATDIAARGLDISHVAHVINYDLPQDPEDYIHRIGRTARAGALGKALSFVTHEDKDSWRKISRLLAKSGAKA